jgi:hypothetical protein
VQAFAISPDGRSVAYSSDDLPPVPRSERFNDSFEIGNDDFCDGPATAGAPLGTAAGRMSHAPDERPTDGDEPFHL